VLEDSGWDAKANKGEEEYMPKGIMEELGSSIIVGLGRLIA